MATVQLTTDQVIDLVRQLPPERKREIVMALAADARTGRGDRMAFAQQQLRRLCADRGLDWATLSEDEREALANDLIHEDRSCRK